ncbi:MAG: Uma2 family endonuclease [Spirulinaceae cyanobacterium]
MSTPTPTLLHSAADYLESETTAAERSEYRDGEIVPMTGGTTNHNRLALAFCRAFPAEIAGQTYDCFIGDVKLYIPAKNLYTYPDVMVIAGEPVYHQGRQDTIENPCLLVEVLSKSTQQYDQTDKFDAYRTIPTLQEYVMIDQYNFCVKQYVRGERNRWIFSETVGEAAQLRLESLPFELNFAQLYQRVQFDASDANS